MPVLYRFALALALLTALLSHSTAYAQANSAEPDAGPWATFPLISTTAMVVVPSSGVSVALLGRSDLRDMPGYLRENAVALARDIALGAGPTVADLAQRLHHRDTRAFARALRRHRKPLIALLARDLDDRSAARFLQLALDAQSPKP